jgi:hypothetical protein
MFFPAGFDDPEVMSAVAEVARDPSAIKKYANNQKVRVLAGGSRPQQCAWC